MSTSGLTAQIILKPVNRVMVGHIRSRLPTHALSRQMLTERSREFRSQHQRCHSGFTAIQPRYPYVRQRREV